MQKKRVSLFVAITGILMALSGCVLPSRSVMPATNLECHVFDAFSGQPIPGAQLLLIYTGPNGEVVQEGPFYTGQNGTGRITASKRTIWLKGSDAYFAGGYLRSIKISAPNYEPSGRAEGFDRGSLEKETPHIFKLQPFRNRYGAVRALWREPSLVIIEVLDGPHVGEQLSLPVFAFGGEDITFKKFYLRLSLEEIRKDVETKRVSAFQFNNLFREGLPNEPYDPEEK